MKLTKERLSLTILAALELFAVLLLQGELGLQLGYAPLGKLPTQLLILLDQHATFRHQLLTSLAARETSLTSHREHGHRVNTSDHCIYKLEGNISQPEIASNSPMATLVFGLVNIVDHYSMFTCTQKNSLVF